MIEKYFFAGAKYSWNPPNPIVTDPRDGAIVPSPPTASNLAFQDLDTYHFDTKQANKFRSLGLRKNQAIAHDWLCYIHGRTARTTPTQDCLTGFMSGCFIAVWRDAVGTRHVGHIGTIESAAKDEAPNTTVKQTFSAAMPNNVSAYSPSGSWGYDEIAAAGQKYSNPPFDGWWQVLSLVTATDQFYSMLMMKQRRTDAMITCAGIKSCTGLNYAALQTALA